MIAEPLACTACLHHSIVEDETGREHHVCQAVVPPLQDSSATDEVDESSPTLVICDNARRMGEPCGPDGKLWEPQP